MKLVHAVCILYVENRKREYTWSKEGHIQQI